MKQRLYSWEGVLFATFVMVFAANALTLPDFLTPSNQINMFQLSIEKLIVVLVMAFVIINAEIDLSVGSMMGLSACAFGWMFQQGIDPVLAIGLCILIGAVGGAVNG
jgi:rhamnose transport system permease protein